MASGSEVTLRLSRLVDRSSVGGGGSSSNSVCSVPAAPGSSSGRQGCPVSVDKESGPFKVSSAVTLAAPLEANDFNLL